MTDEKRSGWDRRVERLGKVGDQALRRLARRQGHAMSRYGEAFSKFGRGDHDARRLAESLLKAAADESAAYVKDVYRAGLDCYKAVVAFYGEPPDADADADTDTDAAAEA